MPKFIYTILITLGILTFLLVLSINFINPDNLWLRILVPLILFLNFSLLLPLIYILIIFVIYKIRKLRLPDLLEVYKKFFKKSLRFSIAISILYLLKVYELINNYIFFGLLIFYLCLVIFYPFYKGKKSHKNKKFY